MAEQGPPRRWWSEARVIVTQYVEAADGKITRDVDRVPVDLACLTVSASPAGPARVEIMHATGCHCGDWEALTGKDPNRA